MNTIIIWKYFTAFLYFKVEKFKIKNNKKSVRLEYYTGAAEYMALICKIMLSQFPTSLIILSKKVL